MQSPKRLLLITIFFTPLWLLGSLITVGATAVLLLTPISTTPAVKMEGSKVPDLLPAILGVLPPSDKVLGQSVTSGDVRVVRLYNYLTHRNSPLADYAQDLVRVADKYQLPWTLIPAIAGKESGFCRVIPPNSHNCWGWAIYSGQQSGAAWDSYQEAIETVARGLRQNYFDRGLNTPRKIETRYTPQSAMRDNHWAKDVEAIMQEILRQ